LEVDPSVIQKETVDFLYSNISQYPGKCGLKLIVCEPKNNWKVSLVSIDNGLEMNNELITFLEETPEIDVKVICN
jgi:hypothetical protein